MKALALAAGLVGLIGLAAPALSADLPPAKAPPFVATGPTSGWYLGVDFGGAVQPSAVAFESFAGTGDFYPSGIIAGGSFGYNYWGAGGGLVNFDVDVLYDFGHAGNPCTFVGEDFVASASCSQKDGLLLMQKVNLGLTAWGISGLPPIPNVAPPGQWPVPIHLPSGLMSSNVALYVGGGIAEGERRACVNDLCGSRWDVGPVIDAGLLIPISSGLNVKFEYDAIFWNKSFTPGNAVGVFGTASFDRHTEHVGMIKLDWQIATPLFGIK